MPISGNEDRVPAGAFDADVPTRTRPPTPGAAMLG
jgi:hypothetical protein